MQTTGYYISQLHKAVLSHHGTQKNYKRVVGRLKKHGISEIGLFTVTARHCEENDINPVSMAPDLVEAMTDAYDNAFALQKTDKYYFLEGYSQELKYSKNDKDFICPDCSTITTPANKHCNYATCDKCGKDRARVLSQSHKKKGKSEEKVQPTCDPIATSPSTNEVEKRPTADELKTVPAELIPYISLNGITGVGNEAELSINLPLTQLPDFFNRLGAALIDQSPNIQ